MAVWSSTLRALGTNIVKYRGLVPKNLQSNGAIRSMSDHGPRVFALQPSRWQWNRMKDLLHFYTMLGLIPITAIVTGTYIFVGPATLEEIPEGYTPKHWEYHRNPISRFMSRFIFSSPQQEYEKYLHALWEESEKQKLRQLYTKVKALIEERRDYQAFYYLPMSAKYPRHSRALHEDLTAHHGD